MEINDFMVSKILEYREKHGLTQRGLALKLHIGFGTLQKYEQKRRLIPLEIMHKVAELYGMTLEQLLREMEETETERRKREFAEEIREVCRKYRDVIGD